MTKTPMPGAVEATVVEKTTSDSTTATEVDLPKICEEYDSDDADVVLISSDNYRFKVHSYRLQCFS